MMRIEIYDVECLVNLFTYTGLNRATKEKHQFVIHKSRNEYKQLIEYLLSEKIVMVGFNNLKYDYPLLHHMLNHYNEYVYLDGQALAQKLYEKSQFIIESEFSIIAEKNTKIPQIDIYKIHHWDNPAKACSLKHCEMSMRMDNIEEMPLHHTHWVTKQEEIDMILGYNDHDVDATNMLFDYTIGKTDHAIYKGRDKIALRQLLSRSFKLNLLNHNDVKIGEDLVFNLYAKNSDIPEYVLKKQRTIRPVIHLKDCIQIGRAHV